MFGIIFIEFNITHKTLLLNESKTNIAAIETQTHRELIFDGRCVCVFTEDIGKYAMMNFLWLCVIIMCVGVEFLSVLYVMNVQYTPAGLLTFCTTIHFLYLDVS